MILSMCHLLYIEMRAIYHLVYTFLTPRRLSGQKREKEADTVKVKEGAPSRSCGRGQGVHDWAQPGSAPAKGISVHRRQRFRTAARQWDSLAPEDCGTLVRVIP